MKSFQSLLAGVLLSMTAPVSAHPWNVGGEAGTPVDREALRAHIFQEWLTGHGLSQMTAAALLPSSAAGATPAQALPFQRFPKLQLRWDQDHLYIASNGMPDHNMMVGITAWQQQVPLPQPYTGENAWRIPLHPVPAKTPAMIKGRFLRGAIALGVNGIPIFNPQNNRGEISQEIGELDQWGGHCGRADDYHYHVTPFHLESVVGKGNPVAYALDGYPIFGLTEPDGSPVGTLDECHGHETPGVGYHYHGAREYPYVLGGFHGEVVEVEGQVDPQPHAQPVRGSLQALRGAEITGFESTATDAYKLSYTVDGGKRSVSYQINADGTYPFEFDNGGGEIVQETYTARKGGGGPGGPRGQGRGKGDQGEGMRPGDPPPPPPEGEGARPPRPQAPIQGILDLNGDGFVTAQEFADHAKANAAKSGAPLAEAMAEAREKFRSLDHNQDGKLDTPELDELAGNAPPQRNPRGNEPPPRDDMKPTPGAGRGGKQEAFVPLPDQPRSSDGRFTLSSPVVEDLKDLPTEFTGDGAGISPPLEWTGAPASTRSYALIMDHVAPGGDKKWYWTVWDIPAGVTILPKDSRSVGKTGTGFKGAVGYEPPHSKGPGAKTYVLTLYALSSPLNLTQPPVEVDREVLRNAMQGNVLASSSLRVVHTSNGSAAAGGGEQRPEAPGSMKEPPPSPPSGGDRPKGSGGPGGKGKGGPDQSGLIKPSIDDTIKLNVYADNWFMLYVNGRLVAVDPIQFTPHNVVSVDFLPEYPMTIAVLAKDNADPETGMEYGTKIGDGGFILKFGDGTVTNATWKAKNFFQGPLNSDKANPRVRLEALPPDWWTVEFDDSSWANAKEFTVEEVDPKQPYYESDFEGANFIWTDDLALDNTIIFRTRIEKPDWKQRWNTKPDLDVKSAPLR